jgi:hypothetical protein
MKDIGIETGIGAPDGTEGLKEEAVKNGAEVTKNMAGIEPIREKRRNGVDPTYKVDPHTEAGGGFNA